MGNILAVTAIAAMLVLAPGLSGSAYAAPPDTGTITGSVVNGSTGGGVGGQEVKLSAYLNDAPQGVQSATTDGNGRFAFNGLPAGAGYSYDLTATYQEADYLSESVSFEDGNYSKAVEIVVYNSTLTDESITVPSAHTVVYLEEGGLLVKEYARFTNSAPLAYVGAKEVGLGKKETLRFFLPKEATQVQYGLSLMQCCMYPEDESVCDTMVVLPGDKEASYSYRVPYDSGSYVLTEKFYYPTGSYELLVQGDRISVNGGGLGQPQPINLEGQQFTRYSLDGAGVGQVLEINLSGLPRKPGLPVGWMLIAGGAALVVMGGVGFFLLRKTRI